MTTLERILLTHARADRRYHLMLDLLTISIVGVAAVLVWAVWP